MSVKSSVFLQAENLILNKLKKNSPSIRNWMQSYNSETKYIIACYSILVSVQQYMLS